MVCRLLILADDLTGAADAAVRFSVQGIPSAVSVTGTFPGAGGQKSVIAIDTESRHTTPETAFGRVTAAVVEAKRRGIRRFYKKIDSTFRGNVGAELEALIQAAGASRLMLAPAVPRAGRTTRNGFQYVGGALLHETGFARDPRDPVTESSIPAILGRQTRFPVHCIDRRALESFDAATERRSGIFVFDAETDDDLAIIAKRCVDDYDSAVFAGAATFGEMLAKTLPKERAATTAIRCQERLFIVNGSCNEASQRQVETARRGGIWSAFLAPAAITDRLGDPGRDVVEKTVYRLNAEGQALLSTPFVNHPGIQPAAFARAAGRIVAAVLERIPDVNLVVMGGDTAFAVCEALGVETLIPHAEVWPGITACAHDSCAPVGPLILKSGGFGPNDAIGTIQRFLRRAAHSTTEMQ